MTKKILITGLLVAVMAVPFFAIASAQDNTQNDWFNARWQRHQQRIQQFVDNGVITADEAKQLDEHMRQIAPIMQKIYQNGGMGMMGPMGPGRGMRNGTGPGAGTGQCPYFNNGQNQQ